MIRRLLLSGATVLCFAVASCGEPAPVNDNHLELLRAKLDETLPLLYGWEQNAAFIALLAAGAMAAGECKLSEKYIGYLLSEDTPQFIAANNARKFGEILKEASGGFWTEVADVCYPDAATFIVENIAAIPPQSSDAAVPVLQSIAYNFRLMGFDAKADAVVHLLRDMPRTSYSGTPVKTGLAEGLLNQVQAYNKLEQKDKALALLTQMAAGTIEGYAELSDRDAELIAAELAGAEMWNEVLALVMKDARSSWVRKFALNFARKFLERAPIDQAVTLLSFVDPKKRSDILLTYYFAHGASQNPEKLRPYIDQLSNWMLDPLHRAAAEAYYGAWIGPSDRAYSHGFCEKTLATITEIRQNRDVARETLVLAAVRGYGACLYGLDGFKGLKEARASLTNERFKSAAAVGAAYVALEHGDWEGLMAAMKQVSSKDERSAFWQTLAFQVPTDDRYTPGKQYLSFFEDNLSREQTEQGKRHIQVLIDIASGVDDHKLKWVKSEPPKITGQGKEVLDGLAQAGQLIEAGDLSAGRRIFEKLDERVSATGNVEWMSRVAFYMAHTGQWDQGIALASKVRSPVRRAYIFAYMYSIVAGRDGREMALMLKIDGFGL